MTTRNFSLTTVAVAITLTTGLWGAHAIAGTYARPAYVQKTATNALDKTFVEKLGHGNTAEVQLGQLAGQNAASADVKKVAQTIVTDHFQAQEQLKTVGQKISMTVPDAPDAAQKATYTSMSKLTGAAFDKKYIAGQIKDHDATIGLINKEIKSGSNPDVKAYAQAILPKVQMHTAELKRIGASLGVYKGAVPKAMAGKM